MKSRYLLILSLFSAIALSPAMCASAANRLTPAILTLADAPEDTSVIVGVGLYSRVAKVSPVVKTGIVKRFDSKSGFGFIQPDDGGHDVFVPIAQVQRDGMATLVEGQHVEYKLANNREDIFAVDIHFRQ